MNTQVPGDFWSDEQIAVERREAKRELEIARLGLLAAMANCGIPAPATATVSELLDLLDRDARERLRRLRR